MSASGALAGATVPIRTHPAIRSGHLERSLLLYCRQSTIEQVTECWGSTTLQEEQEQIALQFGWPKQRIIVINDDLGKSGSTTVGRDGWDKMLRLIATGSVGGVIALNASRLARQLLNFEELRVLARYNDTVLILDGRVIDPNDHNDVALVQVQAVFAQLDNAARTKHLRDTKLAKARGGATVSSLPIGWIRKPDGTFIKDPEVEPYIETVYEVFREKRTLRSTVAELVRRELKVPTRYREAKLQWKQPAVPIIRRFIVLEAYAGTYVYGKSDCRPEYGLDSKGKPRRRKLPESEWICHEDHHPAYISRAERVQFLGWLAGNRFEKRNRPNSGAALTQGLLQCRKCGEMLTSQYPSRGSYRYQCTVRSAASAIPPCFSFAGEEFDEAIERLFLERLGNPFVAVLEKVSQDLLRSRLTEQERIDSESRRLEYNERIAEDRYNEVDPRNRLVAARLEAQLEQAIAERIEFNQRIAARPASPALDGVGDELRRIGKAVVDVPSLWRHPGVSHKERKEMLQCLIDRIIVNRTDVAIEAEIQWLDGTITSLRLLHLGGIRERVRQLHAEGLSARSIRDGLAAGDPETGQKWCYTVTHIYQILRVLGLRPNAANEQMREATIEIDRLYDQGFTLEQIAKELHDLGYRTLRGKPWNASNVFHWASRSDRRDSLDAMHYSLLDDAKRRGLTNAQTADELNLNEVPRAGGKIWTADTVRQRRKYLNYRRSHAPAFSDDSSPTPDPCSS